MEVRLGISAKVGHRQRNSEFNVASKERGREREGGREGSIAGLLCCERECELGEGGGW